MATMATVKASDCTVDKAVKKAEQAFFRRLNGVVEPLLRHGVGSFSSTPASLVLLETTGFRSGVTRSTPLWSVKLGPYRLVSTVRGERSFWVKNLQKRPEATVFAGGEGREADAIVIAPDFDNTDEWELAPPLRRVLEFLKSRARQGWAFALLVPAEGGSARA